MFHRLGMIGVLFSLAGSGLLAQENSKWGGWTEVDGDRDWIQLNVVSWSREGITVDLFGPRLYRQPLVEFEQDQQLRLAVDVPLGKIDLTGKVIDGVIDGVLDLEGKRIGSFHLTRLDNENTADTDRFLGTYRTREGERVIVVRRSQGGMRLISKQNGSWTFDAFLPWETNKYFESTVDSPCLPPNRWIEFHGKPGDEFPRLELHRKGGAPVEYAATHEIRVDEIVVENGDIKLPGMILLPPGKGPFPVVIWNHGSGPVCADAAWDMFHAIRMVEELDVAVINYDKRGAGRANGNESTATHIDLASDLSSIVRHCQTDERLIPELIGVGGTSQSPSWPIPWATSRSEEIRFVIALAGQVGSVDEADLFNLTNRLKRAKFDEQEIGAAREFANKHVEFIRNPERQSEYDRFLDAHRDETWFELVDRFAVLSTPLNDPALEQYRHNLKIGSSLDGWRKVEVPVFFGFGEDDHLVDVATSVQRLKGLMRDGRRNFELHVYPSPAGHAIGTSATPTYFRDLRKWFQSSVLGPYRQSQNDRN